MTEAGPAYWKTNERNEKQRFHVFFGLRVSQVLYMMVPRSFITVTKMLTSFPCILIGSGFPSWYCFYGGCYGVGTVFPRVPLRSKKRVPFDFLFGFSFGVLRSFCRRPLVHFYSLAMLASILNPSIFCRMARDKKHSIFWAIPKICPTKSARLDIREFLFFSRGIIDAIV